MTLGTSGVDAESMDEQRWVLTMATDAARRVPAYARFLEDRGLDARNLAGLAITDLPLMTKAEYLRQFDLPELLWDGQFDGAAMISMSSGSSGLPFYWPRDGVAATESWQLHERLLQPYSTKTRSTLCLVAYAMGTWIAGTYTVRALQDLVERGHRLTVLAPGIDIEENVRALDDLGPRFEQTIVLVPRSVLCPSASSAIACSVKVPLPRFGRKLVSIR